jgi:cadmium resistance protein CadD (predicted permease)
MVDFFSLVGIGISAFVATNVDDIFVLMIFFSNSGFHRGQVVVGQFLGIGLLIVISTLGAILALVIPQSIIGLLGFVPVSIGIVKLIQLRKRSIFIPEQTTERGSRWHRLSMLTVAAVTFSNGGDNIGIYTPLFAKYSSANEVIFVSIIFMAMTAVWCVVAYFLVAMDEIYFRYFDLPGVRVKI